MEYPEDEIARINEENFSTYFICTLGTPPNVIDILTIIHKNVDFNDAEEEAVIHKMPNNTVLKMIPYNFLKKVKLLSRRDKDLWDIARLDELKLKSKKK